MNIQINNLTLNYEIHGNGKPIILLHGNSESLEIFDKLINKLKETHKVYAIDSRCHGKSEKTKEISYDLMANDIIEFIKKLNIEKPILYGFSDGGIIGLLIAMREPNLLSKLIISGANLNPSVLSKSMIFFIRITYFLTRNNLFKMMADEPNIQPEQLKNIIIPTVVLAGEKDIVSYEHTKLIADNIKNSVLEIIPKENHGSYIIHNEKLYDIIEKYL